MIRSNIYFFNPTCELAVANGSFSYMAPLLLQEMERDLSILPLAFCTENDIVLTENIPSMEFVQKLNDFGFEMPHFCTLSEIENLPANSFEAISPWGWSPAAHFKFKNLKSKCADLFKKSPVSGWDDKHKLLFERSTSLDFLSGILNESPPCWFIRKEELGRIVMSVEEIEGLLLNHTSLVLKAPLSSSGRGIQIIRKTNLNASNRQWISGVLKQQSYLIAEPFLEKIMDISFQFRISANSEVEYIGYSVFETNSNGQYKGTFIRPELSKLIKNEYVVKTEIMIKTTAYIITKALETSVYAKLHRGFLGVDSMIINSKGQLMMQPCIEIKENISFWGRCFWKEKFIRWHPASSNFFTGRKTNTKILSLNKPNYFHLNY